jgi:hypothetical protein
VVDCSLGWLSSTLDSVEPVDILSLSKETSITRALMFIFSTPPRRCRSSLCRSPRVPEEAARRSENALSIQRDPGVGS